MGNCCSAAETSDLAVTSLSSPIRALSIWGACPGPAGEVDDPIQQCNQQRIACQTVLLLTVSAVADLQ